METELEVIDRMGFNAYFLIVWDFVDFAKRNGIAVGPGRGSAAGSIVAYSLRITDVDPLAYDLLFERFLNPERVSMPDIDIDFSVRGRERVLRYVIEKYGRESVAQIVTFGRMAPRQATRDAARVLGHDYGVGDRLAKLIPDPQQGRAPSFEDCLADGEPLRAAYDEDPTARQIVDVARGLEGVVRNSSIHAAAVVIADRPLTDIVPLQLADAGRRRGRRAPVPHGHAVLDEADRGDRPAEDGLPRAAQPRRDRGRARHHRALERDAARTWRRCPLDDPATYEMLARGDSVGVFQFESEGMREALKKVRPDCFDDLVALNALYRPGAMDQIPTYARGKRNPGADQLRRRAAAPDPRSPRWASSSTRSRRCGSPRRSPASRARRPTTCARRSARRTARRWRSSKPEFVAGARASGTSDAVIDFLWTTNEKSADYSFNRSHAACYALIAYRTAWLKANHPAEYMAALISSVMSTKDRVPFFVARCEEMGIEILPPDVNLSDHEFTVVERNIRFGLDAVKGVGYQAVEAIKRARDEGGPFTSLWDFCERVDARAVNKKAIEALIKCGAFGSTGATPPRHARGARAGAGRRPEGPAGRADRRRARSSISATAGAPGQRPRRDPPADLDDRVRPARTARGREGGDRPVHLRAPAQGRSRGADAGRRLPARRGARAARQGERDDRRDRHRRRARSARGPAADMMFATLDDLEGQVEIIVFGAALEKFEGTLAVDSIVIVRGRVDQKEEGRTTVVAQSVEPFRPDPEEVARAHAAALEAARPKPLHVRLGDGCRFAEVLEDLKHVLGTFPGRSEVVIELSDGRRVRLGSDFRVEPSAGLRAELEHLLGGPVRLVA